MAWYICKGMSGWKQWNKKGIAGNNESRWVMTVNESLQRHQCRINKETKSTELDKTGYMSQKDANGSQWRKWRKRKYTVCRCERVGWLYEHEWKQERKWMARSVLMVMAELGLHIEGKTLVGKWGNGLLRKGREGRKEGESVMDWFNDCVRMAVDGKRVAGMMAGMVI